MRRKTKAHLSDYDNAGKELFLQALRLMRAEMTKKYTQVSPLEVSFSIFDRYHSLRGVVFKRYHFFF